MLKTHQKLIFGLIAYAVIVRLVPYFLSLFGMSINPETTIWPWNFSPLGALCLFGAARFSQRRWSFLVPAAVLLTSSVGIGVLSGHADWAFPPIVFVVLGCFLLTTTLGLWLRKRRTFASIAGTALLAETIFFLVTNFAMWALGDGTLYPHTLPGLGACYIAGIPFFRNSLIGMGVFGTVLFRLPAMIDERSPARDPIAVPITE